MDHLFHLLALTTYILIFLNTAWSIDKADFLDKCVSSRNHKNVPGPEGTALKSCQRWNKKSCCTWNTTSRIDQDGTLSLYGMILDQCPQKKNMSEKCRKHFDQDTCFYECSPNLGPWIEVDPLSKVTRKERVRNVPLCASDCIAWYHDCMFDYTCNDNWGKNWIWKKKGTPEMCPKTKTCKTFREYFSGPQEFCEKIFNYSFKYESDENNCMNLAPTGSKNEQFAIKKAAELARAKSGSCPISYFSALFFGCSIFNVFFLIN